MRPQAQVFGHCSLQICLHAIQDWNEADKQRKLLFYTPSISFTFLFLSLSFIPTCLPSSFPPLSLLTHVHTIPFPLPPFLVPTGYPARIWPNGKPDPSREPRESLLHQFRSGSSTAWTVHHQRRQYVSLTDVSLVPRPHPLMRRNGVVNPVEFLELVHALATL